MNNFYSAKGWMLMKICATQTLIAVVFSGLALAHPGNAQILDREISLEVSEESFANTLGQIAAQSQAYFAYSPDLLDVRDHITLKVAREPLRAVLERLLAPRGISYAVHSDGTTIFLKRSPNEQVGNVIADPVMPAVNEITGIVRDQAGQPLVGVNILVRGTTNGTTSDSRGQFTIQADPGQELVFSYIGYQTFTVLVSEATTIEVTLTEDTHTLREVVVNVGYWEVNEKEQTGSVTRLSAEQIAQQPVTNPLQAMQGRMTGVYIQQNTGMPGGGFSVQIRGQNSLRTGLDGLPNGNVPLYIVDDVPFTGESLMSGTITSGNLRGGNPLAALNPADIESIEVLKDADATAIYGSRGANGVVLITTKSGRSGKDALTLDFSSGIGKVTRFMDLLSTKDYLAMRKEAVKNDGLTDLVGMPALNAYWPDLVLWDSTRYTDWQKELIGGTANIVNAQVSLTGGSVNTRYSVGGSYYKESTVFPGDNDFQRASGRVTLRHTSPDGKFTIATNANYTSSWSDIPSIDFASEAIKLAPNAPALYNSQGGLNWENGSWVNPLALLERKYTNRISNMVSSLGASYEFVKDMRVKLDLGHTAMHVNEIRINPLRALNPVDLAGRTGSSSFGKAAINTWIVEPQVEYAREFGSLRFTTLVGSTFQQSVQEGETVQASGYTNDALIENIKAAASVSVLEATYAQYRYAAVFSRMNLVWRDKWILNLTGRRDGSSRFGPGKKFGTFGAVGAAWVFSAEEWMRNMPVISYGKLRASYGTTGSDAIGNYQYLDTYRASDYPYGGSAGLVMTRLSNSKYSWETNRKFETALDVALLNDRVSVSAAFYRNRSGNQLVGLPLPVMTGQSSVQFNLPAEVENRGWEFMVRTVNIKNADMEWSTDVNASLPRNTLIRFPDLESFPAYQQQYEVGKPVYGYRALVFNGVDPEYGGYRFKDLSGDGSVTAEDLKIVNSLSQRVFGGIGNSIRYKAFRLDFFIQFVKQSGYSYHRAFPFPGSHSNQPVEVMNRWQESGDEAAIQKFAVFALDGRASSGYSRLLYSDKAIVDASFVRLKNVSASWDLPATWVKKARMQSARLYLQGQNLLTHTKYIGLDPENQNPASIPPLTVYMAGIQLKF